MIRTTPVGKSRARDGAGAAMNQAAASAAIRRFSGMVLPLYFLCASVDGPQRYRLIVWWKGRAVQWTPPMDHSTKSIAEFSTRLAYADLPADVVHDCKRRIIDTVGAGIAAFDEEPSRIARAVAMRTEVAGGATLIGTSHRTLPELAAFANSVASRY